MKTKIINIRDTREFMHKMIQVQMKRPPVTNFTAQSYFHYRGDGRTEFHAHVSHPSALKGGNWILGMSADCSALFHLLTLEGTEDIKAFDDAAFYSRQGHVALWIMYIIQDVGH